MAVTIDERVVEMRFNNKQFESNVQQSINSLDKLDKSVTKLDSSKGLNDFQKKLSNVNFDSMERSLGSLEKRFSTLGIIGKTALEKATEGALGILKKGISAIMSPIQQAKTGGMARALKIEDAKFQLKGLKVAWDDIKDDIDYAVSGTAFGLDSAAKAASQLVASGVKLGDEMKGALRGISGVAAMANTSYEEISPIFTTVAGQGKLMTMQLRQLEARGLNAASEIGKYLGKTEQQVREMVRKGKIDFKTFSTAMDSAFGEHAKDANSTFKGSMDNMKAALNRLGADIAGPYLKSMIGVFNDARVAIDNIHIALKPVIEEINKWVEIVALAKRAAIKWVTTSETVKKNFNEFVKVLQAISRTAADFIPRLIDYLKPIGATIRDIGVAMSDIMVTLFGVKTTLTPLQVVLLGISRTIQVVLVLINGVLTAIKNILRYLADSGVLQSLMDRLLPLTKFVLPALVVWLVLSKKQMFGVAAAISAVVLAITALYKLGIIQKVVETGKKVVSFIKNIVSTVYNGVAPLVKFLIWAGKNIIKLIYNTLTGNDQAVQEILAEMGNIGWIIGKFGNLAGTIGKVFATVGSAISSFCSELQPAGTYVVFLATVLIFSLRRISTAIKLVAKTVNTFKLDSLVKGIKDIANSFNPLGFMNTLSTGVSDFLKQMAKSEQLKSKAIFIGVLAASLLAFAVACGILAKEVDPDSFLKIAAGITVITVGLAALALALGHAIPKKVLEESAKSVKGQLSDLMESVKIKALSGFLRTIILLIGALSIAFIELHKAMPAADVAIIAASLGGIVAVFTGLMILVGKIGKASSMAVKLIAFGAAVVSMSVGLLILAKAIASFPKIEKDIKVLDTILVVLGSAAGLLAAAWAASKLLNKVSIGFLNFAISALSLALILKMLPGVILAFGESLAKIGVAFKDAMTASKDIIGTMLLKAAAAFAVVIFVSKFAKRAIPAFAIMIGTVLSMILFTEYLRRIGSNQQAIANAAAAFNQLVGVFAGLMIIIGFLMLASSVAKYALKSAALIIAIPVSMIALVGVLWVLNNVIGGLDDSQLLRLGAALASMTVILGLLTVLSAKFKGSLITILGLTVMILAVTGSIKALAAFAADNPISIILSAVSIVGVLITLVAIIKVLGSVLKKVNVIKIAASMIVMTAAIGSIAKALSSILTASGGDWVQMLAASTTLISLISMISLIVVALLKVSKEKGTKLLGVIKILMILKAVTKSLVSVTKALGGIAGENFGSMMGAVLGMTTLLAALVGATMVLGKVKTKGSAIKNAIMLGAVAGAISTMVKSMKTLSGIDFASLMSSAVAIALLTGILVGATYLLANVKPGSLTDILKISGLFVGLSAVMLIIGATLTALAPYDWNSIMFAAISISAVFAVLVAAVAVMASIPVMNPIGMLAMVAAMGLLAIEMIPVAACLAMLANYNWASLLAAAGSLALVLATMGGLAALMANMPMLNPLGLIAFAGAMVVLTVALIPLTAAIYTLAQLPADALIRSSLAIAGLIVVLTGALALITLIPGAAMAAIPVALAFAIAMTSLGVSALMVGAGLALASAALTEFIGFLIQNGDKVIKALTDFGTGVAKMVVKIGKGVAKSAKTQAKAIAKAILTVLGALGTGIVDLVTTVIVGVLTAVDTGLDMLNTTIWTRGVQLIRTIYDLILSAINAISMGLDAIVDVVLHGGEIGDWIGKSVAGGIIGSEPYVEAAATEMGAAAEESLRNRVDVHSFSDLFAGIGEWLPISFAGGIEDGTGDVKDAAEGMGDAAVEGAEKKNIGSSILDGIKNLVSSDKLKGLGDTAGKLFGGSFVESLSGIFSGSSDGLFGKMSETFDEEAARQIAKEGLYKRYEYDKSFRKAIEDERGRSAYSKKIKDTTVWNDALTASIENQRKAFDEDRDAAGGLADMLKKYLGIEDETEEETTEYGDSADGAAGDTDKLKVSVGGATDAFSEFDRVVETTTKNLTKNVKTNIQGVEEWREGIEALIARGVDSKVIKQLVDLGPSGSYDYVATMLTMGPKQLKKYSKQLAKALKLPEKATRELLGYFTQDGENATDQFRKGMVKKAKDPGKDFTIGIVQKTGKALKKQLKKQLDNLDIAKLIKDSKSGTLTKALQAYMDATTSKSKDAQKAFKEYITNAYIASLDESQRQAALKKSSEELSKDVSKWWKQQEKAVQESVHSQIRSMEDLQESYTKTGKEYKKELTKQNKDYQEAFYNRRVAAARAYALGLNKFGKAIFNEMSDSDILAFNEGYEKAFSNGGQSAANAYVKSFKQEFMGSEKDLTAAAESYEAVITTKNKKKIAEWAESNSKYMTAIKKPAEIYKDVLDDISKGTTKLLKENKSFKKMSKTIGTAFSNMGESFDLKNVKLGRKILEDYAKELLDLDEIQKQSEKTGVKSSELVTENLEKIKSSLEDFHKSVRDSLKESLQSFDEFDKGEKKSISSMIKNLESNITTLNEWRANIKKMQELGYSREVIESMTAKGVGSYREVEALVKDVSQHQIDEINQMWAQVADQTEDAASEALGAVALSTKTVGVDTVDGFVSAYEENKDTISTAVATTTGEAILDGLQESSNIVAKADKSKLINSLIDQYLNIVTNKAIPKQVKDGMLKQIFDIMNDPNVSDETKSAITRLYNDPSISAAIKTEIATKYGNAIASGTNKAVNGQKKPLKDKMTKLGKQGAKGLASGLKDQESLDTVSKATNKLIKLGVVHPAKEALQIHSPSRVFQQIGELTAEGFAVGFGNSTYTVESEVDSFTEAILAYAQRLADDLDAAMPAEDDFTIKPVLDLDNLQNAHSMIQSMLGNGDIAVKSSTLASQTATQSEWNMLSKALSGIGGTSTTNTYGDIQITVNAPEGADANDIANAVMAKIQQSVDRRKYV